MKNILITAGLTVIISLSFSSCGKKAEDHKSGSPENITKDNTDFSLLEETHKDLEAAIISNDVIRFKRILDTQKQVNLDIILPSGETLMTTAVLNDNLQIVQLLKTATASIVKRNNKSETPFMIAARLGQETMVLLLFTLDAKTDEKNPDGNTALHLAILNRHEDVAETLINKKANYEITNESNQSPLRLAEAMGLTKVVNAIKREMYKDDALPSAKLFEDVLANGTNSLLSDYIFYYKKKGLLGNYPNLNFFDIVIKNQKHDEALSMVSTLIENGVSLEGPTAATVTPLVSAIQKDYENFVLLFLSKGAKVNTVDSSGKSALIWAIHANSAPIVKHLVDKNAQDKYTYWIDGKKKTMKACDEARTVRSTLKTDEAKKSNEEIMDRLNCGLRWLF
jgi:ankyrin repeat protein